MGFKPIAAKTRAKALALIDNGRTIPSVAKETKLSPSTIRTWLVRRAHKQQKLLNKPGALDGRIQETIISEQDIKIKDMQTVIDCLRVERRQLEDVRQARIQEIDSLNEKNKKLNNELLNLQFQNRSLKEVIKTTYIIWE